jgi:DNA-binding transcriptional LysR family regulator
MVEVERQGSITKAAASLYMGQPNLSKAIKEMEKEIGIPIFRRSPKGVVPTEKGKEFLQYAKAILVQMDKMENLYKDNGENRVSFSLLVPRATYITYAFTEFLNKIGGAETIDIKFRETNSMEAINAIVECECEMGIIRYPIAYESFFMPLIEEKNLVVNNSWQYDQLIVVSENSKLTQESVIDEKVLENYIEILHGDNILPNISSAYQKKRSAIDSPKKHIYIYERGSQFDILSSCPEAYMWVSPIPEEILKRYGLKQLECPAMHRTHKDVLIMQNSYRLSSADQMFLDELERVRGLMHESVHSA